MRIIMITVCLTFADTLVAGRMQVQKQTPTKSLKHQRRKIWDLAGHFHCSVIGTCLSLVELRRMARKIKMPPEIASNDYRLHVAFVKLVEERSEQARLVNKHLDRKYQETIRKFLASENAAELQRLWDAATQEGEIAAAYWALLTHPLTDEDLAAGAHGSVHMLSHLSGASVRVDMQRLVKLRKEAPRLRTRIADQERALARLRGEVSSYRHRFHHQDATIQRLEREKRALQARVNALEKDELVERLRAHVEEHSDQLAASRVHAERAEKESEFWRRKSERLKERSEQLARRLLRADAERDAAESALALMFGPDCGSCENQSECATQMDLCKRCILFVGGRNRQCAHFKALVEKGNGQFLHHDGGLEQSSQRLAALLARADAVLCPLDCISHDAVKRIKRDCKRYGKPLKLLPQASLAAFARGLQEVVEK